MKRIILNKPSNNEDLIDLLDKTLKDNFENQEIIIRCISSADHPNKSQDELADHIIKSGTDKYDVSKKMVGHNAYKKWHIDFFAIPVKVNSDTSVFSEIFDDFSRGAIEDRGHSVSVDIVIIYKSTKCKMIPNVYEGQSHSDAFIFKDPKNKKGALVGLITLK